MSRQIQRYVLRVSEILYGRVASAAKRADLSINEWLTVAVTEKLDGKEPLPSTDARSIVGFARGDSTQPVAKPKAQDLAARFGITTAAQLSTQPSPPGESLPPVVFVGNCPVEDIVPLRDWMKFYRELGEMEPSEAEYEFNQAVAGVKLPVGFRKMPAPKQVQWLSLNVSQ